MAGYLNHSISLMSGDGSSILNGSGDSSRLNMRESSPLQIFVKAKKKINDIFIEIEDYVKDTVRFTKCEFMLRCLQVHLCLIETTALKTY